MLWLTGCAQHRQPPPSNTTNISSLWAAHHARIKALNNWQAKGKLGYNSSSNKGSAWFDWTQKNEEFTLYLSGPIGIGTTTIHGNARLVTLDKPGEVNIQAPSPDQLANTLFGFHLPLTQLRYWVKGIPAPGPSTIEAFNAQGLASKFKQDGWAISVQNHQHYANIPLPGKIVAKGQGLVFTMILKKWQAQSSTQQNTPSRQQKPLSRQQPSS